MIKFYQKIVNIGRKRADKLIRTPRKTRKGCGFIELSFINQPFYVIFKFSKSLLI